MAMNTDDPGVKTKNVGKTKKTPDILPLRAEGFGSFEFWKKELKAAEQKRDDDFKPDWDHNVKSYLAKPLISTPDIDKIIVPKDFANVEQKKAQLFFQIPKIQCTPRRPEFEDVVPLAQAVLRFYLSRHRVDAMSCMNRVLFDCLCLSALMCSKIGYESVQDGTKTVMTQQPNPAAGQPAPAAPPIGGMPPQGPTATPGSVLGLSAPPQPQTIPVPQEAPRIISERYFWEPISPAKMLIPEKFTGNNYDLAPWIGFEFVEPWDVAKRKYKLNDEDVSRSSGDDDHKIYSEKNVTTRAAVDTVRGWEIWYRASLYDPTEKNPDKIRLLILVDGYDQPVKHRDSPYQKFDPNTGELTIGMRGYPVHVGPIRDLTDSAFPPSETSISRALVDELGKFRTQMILLRDRAVSTMLVDEGRIGGPQTLEKIRRGILGAWVPVPNLDPNNPPVVEAAKAHTNQDNYRANDYIDRDIDQVWAFGPNQHGQEASESRTATELSIAQTAANSRIGMDRNRVVDYFLKGCEKLWSLLQLFATDDEYVQIIGENGAARLQKWNRQTIAGEFIFDANADSAMQPDYNQERTFALKEYELLRKDPQVNPSELLHRVARAFDHDPARLIIEQPPQEHPQPVKAAFTFKGEDLDIGKPEFPIILALLRQSGYQIPDQLIAQAQQHKQMQSAVMAHAGVADPGLLPAGSEAVPPTPPMPPMPHGGMAEKAPRLNKHQDKTTGEQIGTKPLNQRMGVQ